MIKRVHIEFLRKVTRVRKRTPKYMIYGELGRFPLDIIIKQRWLSFWTGMLTSKTTKLSYQIYKYLLNSPQINSKRIVSVQTILNNAGRQDIWLNQNESTPKSTGKLIKQTLIDQFFQQVLGFQQEISLKKIFGGSQILTINATNFAGLDEIPIYPHSGPSLDAD